MSASFCDDDSVTFTSTTVVPPDAEIAYLLETDLRSMQYTTTAYDFAIDEEPPETPMSTCRYKYKIVSAEKRASDLQTVLTLKDLVEFENGDLFPYVCWNKTRCWCAEGWQVSPGYSCPTDVDWTDLQEGPIAKEHHPEMSWKYKRPDGITIKIWIKQNNRVYPDGIVLATDVYSRYPTRFSDDFRHAFAIKTYR